ncbi:MAG: aminopeptidase P family N-terminal domain-containing protein, partial [Saprospiraceae bacterium]|nr:aminopeptidase P family N-terminal domain-containing protein [Saprospiraceae bacterium]
MVAHNIDAIIIPSSDPHQSEYIAEHWQERVWISGFTGSAGLVAVTKDHAGLWTDSRYFLQGEMELKGTGVELHKMLNQFGTPYIDFLAENLSKGSRVAVNGLMFSKAVVDTMKKSFAQSGIDLVYNLDLISEIWTNRPPLSDAPIFYHDEKFSGSTIADKFEQIRTTLKDNRADYHLITTLDDIAWTFNIRGNDVMYNPVSVAYAIVGKSDAHIFVNEKKLSDQVKKQFSKNNIKIYPNSEIVGFLNKMKESEYILVDTQLCNQTIYDAINGKIIQGNSIPKFLKAIKNGTEIGHIRNVMKKDGAALANTFYWLDQSLSSGQKINEVDVARKLAEHRSQQKFYQGESFGAIIGYNENGAIIHYHPEPETCKTIKPEGILLVDSGGQYSDGTTD